MVDDVLPEDEQSISSRERCRPAQRSMHLAIAQRASDALSFRLKCEDMATRRTLVLSRSPKAGDIGRANAVRIDVGRHAAT